MSDINWQRMPCSICKETFMFWKEVDRLVEALDKYNIHKPECRIEFYKGYLLNDCTCYQGSCAAIALTEFHKKYPKGEK